MADDAGALLVRSGLITPSSLEQARAQVEQLGGTIGEQLVTAGVISDDALTDFYKQRLLVPQVNPNSLARLPIRVIAAIPNDMAVELRAIPVALDNDNNLTVAMSDPSDSHAVDEIGFFTGAFVVRAVATQMQIAWCLAHYYGHVTPLGQRLLAPGAGAAPSAPAPRMKGVTAEVKALRHRRIQPVAGDDPAPEPITEARDTEPTAAPPPEPDASDVLPTKQPRARSVSGEIKVPKRAPSIKPMPIEDADSGPVITVEHVPTIDSGPVITVEHAPAIDSGPVITVVPAEEATEPVPAPVPKRKKPAQPDPPELYARAGEVDINTGKVQRVEVDEEPSILVAAEALASGNPPEARSGEVVIGDVAEPPLPARPSIEIDEAFDRESRPVMSPQRGPGDSVTTLPRAPSVADFPDDDDEVLILEPKKQPRRDRRTQIGVGLRPATAPVPPDQAAPARIDDAKTAQHHAADAPVAEATPRPALSPEHDDLDDGWGPPGTTIPPPLLGAVPGSDDDGVPGRIPMGDMDSAPLIVAPPAPPQPSLSSPHISTGALGDAVRALEDSTSQLLGLIRKLEHATTRDEVVALMIEHLGATHRRAGFFVIKPAATKGVTELSVFAVSPKPATPPSATLRLDRPSTLQDVVGTRLPYRGPMHDHDSRAFLASALGNTPAELLLVPIAVRERVVGVLFGDHRTRHAFDDQLSLASRAAGQALERILKAKRG